MKCVNANIIIFVVEFEHIYIHIRMLWLQRMSLSMFVSLGFELAACRPLPSNVAYTEIKIDLHSNLRIFVSNHEFSTRV